MCSHISAGWILRDSRASAKTDSLLFVLVSTQTDFRLLIVSNWFHTAISVTNAVSPLIEYDYHSLDRSFHVSVLPSVILQSSYLLDPHGVSFTSYRHCHESLFKLAADWCEDISAPSYPQQLLFILVCVECFISSSAFHSLTSPPDLICCQFHDNHTLKLGIITLMLRNRVVSFSCSLFEDC